MNFLKDIKYVIFDLDGTLVNSSASIIKSLQKAFSENGIETKEEIDQDIIGPPLKDILKTLSGHTHDSLIDDLSKSFKKHYDSTGYMKTEVFPGVYDMLLSIKSRDIAMYIATNKRINPTKKILSFLNWGSFFDGVYALDSFQNVSKKEEIIENIIVRHDLDKNRTVYIGDTNGDSLSAYKAKVHYIMALWGYGVDVCTTSISAKHPQDLIHLLNR